MSLVQTCLCLCFLGNGSERNEIQQNITECDLCLCFVFGIRIRTALSTMLLHGMNPESHGQNSGTLTMFLEKYQDYEPSYFQLAA